MRRARHDRRPVLDRPDHRCLIHAIEIGSGGELLLATHSVDHALLSARKYGVRENGEIAEHPKQIYALAERRYYAPRSYRRLHLHHAAREFFYQHIGPTRNQKYDCNSRAAIIAPETMQWEAFFQQFPAQKGHRPELLTLGSEVLGRLAGKRFLDWFRSVPQMQAVPG